MTFQFEKSEPTISVVISNINTQSITNAASLAPPNTDLTN
jgi:hypothetical protein